MYKIVIKIYLKCIINFWRLVLLKIIKIMILYLFEQFQNLNFFYCYLAETEEGIFIALLSIGIMFAIGGIVYTYSKIVEKSSAIDQLNDKILTDDTLTLKEVKDLVNNKNDMELDIIPDILDFLLCFTSLCVSTICLGICIEDLMELKELKFKNDFKNIDKVLL